MASPILAANSTWYKGSTDKITITRISIVDSYTATGNEAESWSADADDSGAIKCYILGTELIIAGDGSGTIAANPDSSWLFGGFGSVVSIAGCNLLDCSSVTTLERAFQADIALESVDVSQMVGPTVTTIKAMFQGCKSIRKIDVSKWDTSNIVDIERFLCMPGDAYINYNLTELDVSGWEIHDCASLALFVQGCAAISVLDFSKWDTSKVTKTTNMATNCYALSKIYVSDKWDMSGVTASAYMFDECPKLVGGAGTKYESGKSDATYAVPDNGDSAPGYLTYLGELSFVKPHDIWMIADAIRDIKGDVTAYSLPEMVAVLRNYPVIASQKNWYRSDYDASQITHISITNAYTVTGAEDETWAADEGGTGAIMCYRTGTVLAIVPIEKNKIRLNADSSNMFAEMSAIVQISGFELLDASGVETLEKAFYKNVALTEADISTWRIPKVTNTDSMFGCCVSLTAVSVGSELKALGHRAFYMCDALQTVTGLQNVASIGDEAFFYTPVLTACDLVPDRIGNIGVSACRMSSIEDNLNLNAIPEVNVGDHATRLKRWGTDALDLIQNVVFPDAVCIDVPNADSQLNYPDVPIGKDSGGNTRYAADWGCMTFTLYHIWNALCAGTEQQYDNWLDWWNATLNADGTFADNYNFATTPISDVVSALGWTYESRVNVESEGQLETILARLADGLPVFAVVNSLADGVTHAITIIGCDPETRKLAILDSAAYGQANGLVSWLAYEDLFVGCGEDSDSIRLINYNLP